jgi:hypothetical protein
MARWEIWAFFGAAALVALSFHQQIESIRHDLAQMKELLNTLVRRGGGA